MCNRTGWLDILHLLNAARCDMLIPFILNVSEINYVRKET